MIAKISVWGGYLLKIYVDISQELDFQMNISTDISYTHVYADEMKGRAKPENLVVHNSHNDFAK